LHDGTLRNFAIMIGAWSSPPKLSTVADAPDVHDSSHIHLLRIAQRHGSGQADAFEPALDLTIRRVGLLI